MLIHNWSTLIDIKLVQNFRVTIKMVKTYKQQSIFQ